MKIESRNIIIIALFLFSGCATYDFDKAKEINSVAAYDQFLQEYPKHDLAMEARKLKENAVFDEAKRKDTIEEYRNYLNQYPSGKYSSLAKNRVEQIKDDMAWKKATTTNTAESYQQYLRDYKSGKYVAEAKNNREPLYWEETKRKNTISGYDDFLKEYNSSKYIVEIKAFKEPLIWNAAEKENSLKSLNSYLTQYPNGKFVNKAKEKLEPFHWDEVQNENTLDSVERFLKEYANGTYYKEANQLKIDLIEEFRLEESCANGYSEDCFKLGTLCEDKSNKRPATKTSYTLKSLKFLESGCQLQSDKSCIAHAKKCLNTKDCERKKAISSLAMACDLRDSNCGLYAEQLELNLIKEYTYRSDDSKIRTTEPQLEQSSHTQYSTYRTPDTYETELKTRGVFFPEKYLETKRISGYTYTASSTKLDRYAYMHTKIFNDSCEEANISVDAAFSFKTWDSIKRSIGGAFVGLLVGALVSPDNAGALAAAGAAGGLAPKIVSKSITIPPNSYSVLSVDVDTQSLFGRNREMKSVQINELKVKWGKNKLCATREGLPLIKNLHGSTSADNIKSLYIRACNAGENTFCTYLDSISPAPNYNQLKLLCNDNNKPNLEPACKRIELTL